MDRAGDAMTWWEILLTAGPPTGALLTFGILTLRKAISVENKVVENAEAIDDIATEIKDLRKRDESLGDALTSIAMMSAVALDRTGGPVEGDPKP